MAVYESAPGLIHAMIRPVVVHGTGAQPRAGAGPKPCQPRARARRETAARSTRRPSVETSLT